MVVGLVDFLSSFVSGPGTLWVAILSTSSSTTSTPPLSSPLPTAWTLSKPHLLSTPLPSFLSIVYIAEELRWIGMAFAVVLLMTVSDINGVVVEGGCLLAELP